MDGHDPVASPHWVRKSFGIVFQDPSLDEELTNLTTYQQAYTAGARMLTVVDQLYQTLMQIQ